MLKQEYFQLAMDHECFRSKAWVISAFSVVTGQPASPAINLTPGEMAASSLRLKREAGKLVFQHPQTGEADFIEDVTDFDAPLFRFKDPVSLKANACANLKTAVDTTYGAWLFNNIVCVYPFGEKIAFSPNGYTIREIEKQIEARLTDDPEAGTEAAVVTDPLTAPIYVSEYIRYNEAAGSLTGFTQLCVPAATPYTLVTGPKVLERRAELFAQYKDRLHDPAIQARIGDELIKLDKEWIAEDPERGFYYKSKSFDVVRKKLLMFQGAESGFGQTGQFIGTSLDEGMRPENIPAMASAARDGSYSRGAQTALGGERTKFNLRMFQNAEVKDGDCGSKVGIPIKLTETNGSNFVGNYMLENGTPILLTEDAVKRLRNREVEIRTPLFCHAEGASYCSVCVGDRIAQTKEALATYAGDVGSTLMLLMMGKMHGRALLTEKYNIKRSIT